jgi:predicted DNA-binding transcriptional regulator YafY
MSDIVSHIYRLHDLLKRGRRLTIAEMTRCLGCSRRTVMRLKKVMIERLEAPIVYSPSQRRFAYDHRGERYELPGMWLTAGELSALATLTHLVEELDPGLLQNGLAVAKRRITRALRAEGIDADRLVGRMRTFAMARRRVDTTTFTAVAEALLRTRRLRIRYGAPETSPREISPQQLVRYRDNWYLDAFCHTREDLRTFALARISAVELLAVRAYRVGKRRLLEHFAGAYGIFSGPATHTALVRFSGPAARYVASEQWHPRQKGRRLSDNTYELRVPFGDPRELAGDIMRWGPYAKVIEPKNLRLHVAKALREAALHYDDTR